MSEALNLAKNPNTSPEKLIALLLENQGNDEVLSAIAVHPNMTKELLIELARNDDPYNDNEADYFDRTDRNPAIDLLLLQTIKISSR